MNLDVRPSDRFRIKHPSYGYVEKLEERKWQGEKQGATFNHDVGKAMVLTWAEMRQTRDASGAGIMLLLVASYTGLQLEKVE